MAKYTVELRYLIESGYNLTALNSYPIFDEAYRQTLNTYILNHFWVREIGAETAGLFNFYLTNTMNEIMPYYNQLFESARIAISPLRNYSTSETLNKTERGNGATHATSGANSSGASKAVESRPADGLIHMGDIEDEVYANTANIGNSTNTTNGTSDATNTNKVETEYIKGLSGYTGISESELIIQYRKSIINVVQLLLADKNLNQCFMGVY